MEDVSLIDTVVAMDQSTFRVGNSPGVGHDAATQENVAAATTITSSSSTLLSRLDSGIRHGTPEKKLGNKVQPSPSSMELLRKMALQYSMYCQTDLSAQVRCSMYNTFLNYFLKLLSRVESIM